MSEENPKQNAAGVAELIQRIRDEGVERAKDEAEAIMLEAHQKAAATVAEAQEKAKAELEAAREKIQTEEYASQEALKLAARDTVKKLGAEVSRVFRSQLESIVHKELGDVSLIREVVVAIAQEAGTVVEPGKAAELTVFFDEDDAESEKRITELIHHLSHEAFKEGLTLKPQPGMQRGVSIKVEGSDVMIDVNEETLTELLNHQLLPRYRELLRSEHMKISENPA